MYISLTLKSSAVGAGAPLRKAQHFLFSWAQGGWVCVCVGVGGRRRLEALNIYLYCAEGKRFTCRGFTKARPQLANDLFVPNFEKWNDSKPTGALVLFFFFFKTPKNIPSRGFFPLSLQAAPLKVGVRQKKASFKQCREVRKKKESERDFQKALSCHS